MHLTLHVFVYGIMPTLSVMQWKWVIEGLEAVITGCMWVTNTSGASRTQLSTPSRAAEKSPGIYTHNYHYLLYGFKSLTVCVCVHSPVCVWEIHYGMCVCLCVVLGRMSRSNWIGITPLFSNSCFGSSVPRVCFDNLVWETQTYSKLLPLCLCSS